MTHKRRIFRDRSPWPRVLAYLVLLLWIVYASMMYALDPYSLDAPYRVWMGLACGGVVVVYRLIAAVWEV